jgi:hypothetical protein
MGDASAPGVEVVTTADAAERRGSPAEAGAASAPPDLPRIGLEFVPPEPGEEAHEAYEDALAAILRSDNAAAQEGFREALRLAPAHDIARYDLARVLWRLGDSAGAERELLAVMERDYSRFLPRFEADEEWTTLRETAEGDRVRAALARFDEAWRVAIAAGTPLVLWRPGDVHWDNGRPHRPSPGELVRPVLYMHEWRRFVPLGSFQRGALAALADPETGWAVVVSGEYLAEGGACAEQYHDVSILLFPLEPADRPRSRESLGSMNSIKFGAAAGGACYSFFACYREPQASGWRLLGADEHDAQGAGAGCGSGRFVEAGELAPMHGPPPAGFEHRPGQLVTPDGTVLDLPDGLRESIDDGLPVQESYAGVDVAASGDGTHVVVTASIFHGGLLDLAPEPAWRCVVSRVDVPAGSVDLLFEGNCPAGAFFDRHDVLWVQTGATLRRYDPPGTASPEYMLDGLVLFPPEIRINGD